MNLPVRANSVRLIKVCIIVRNKAIGFMGHKFSNKICEFVVLRTSRGLSSPACALRKEFKD